MGYTVFETYRYLILLTNSSEGLFLYARLVCDGLDRLSDLDDIKEEVTNLPDGLSEA